MKNAMHIASYYSVMFFQLNMSLLFFPVSPFLPLFVQACDGAVAFD
jgi:hypothetical protein